MNIHRPQQPGHEQAKEAPNTALEAQKQPQTVERVNGIRRNTLGVGGNILLFSLMLLSACGRIVPGKNVEKVVKPPSSSATVNPGEDLVEPPINSEHTLDGGADSPDGAAGEPPTPEGLHPGKATINMLTPRADHYKVIGRIEGAKEGDTAKIQVNIVMPGGAILPAEITLTAMQFDAEGKLNINPETVKGAKLTIDGKEFTL